MRTPPRARLGTVLLVLLSAGAGCGERAGEDDAAAGPVRLVFRHFEVPGGAAPLDALLDRFEDAHPGIVVDDRVLPSSSDQQHQFYVTNLEAGGADFDVFAVDVIWVAELARAGWLLPVDDVIPPAERDDFLDGPLAACTYRGVLHAAPWFVDGGLLYYREDLLARRGLEPPATWGELIRSTETVLDAEDDPRLLGFLWQGRQYEGLVCVALELVHANGGALVAGGAPALQQPPARAALQAMRDLVTSGTSPPLVATLDEEGARRLFQAGRALYMRNWPYAWTLLQAEGSPVRGRVGVAPMPRFPGGRHVATLGGWQLAVRKGTAHPDAALALLRFLLSPEAQERLVLSTGLKPTRRSVYDAPGVVATDPFVARLIGILEHAEPRPVTPFYPMITEILQAELSAIVTGIRTVEDATRRAAVQIEHVLELDR